MVCRRGVAKGSDFEIRGARGLVSDLPSRPALKLLLALRQGYKSQADLLAEVWGISRYVPARHRAVLHTTVSRLRKVLGEPDWLVTHEEGYSLLENVELISSEDSSGARLP